MIKKQWIPAAIAATAAIGIYLTATDAPGLGGALIGAAITTIPCIAQHNRRTAAHQAALDELEQAKEQYDEARATLGGQRERMRIEFEGRLAEHTGRLNAAHQLEVFRTHCESYEQGATDAFTGRLASFVWPTGASVIPFRARH